MNSKLTVRNLVKYWGCKVKCDNCHFPELEYWFTYITAQYITLYAATKPAGIIREIGFSQIKISDCQLLLTPLSAITDEHAIEVAKVIMQANSKEPKEYEWQIDRRDEEGVLIGDVSDPIATRILISSLCEFIGVDFMENPVAIMNQRPAIDLLRSLGYDCDNAISEGWGVDRLAFVK